MLLTVSPLQAAPPKLSSLYPAGGAPGQSVEVTAGGTFERWPVSVWASDSALAVEVLPDKGKLRIDVPATARPGVYWLRLVDQEGASSLRPWLVDTLPAKAEAEPNDTLYQAKDVPLPQIIDGRIARAEEVDSFLVSLKAGETLIAAVAAHQTLGSPMDAILQVCTKDGYVLEQEDDVRGLDPLIVFTAPSEATYLVRLFAFPATPNANIVLAGGDDFVYRLTLTTGPFLDYCLPLAVSTGRTDLQPFGWNLPNDLSLAAEAPTKPAFSVSDSRAAGSVALPLVEGAPIVALASSDPAAAQEISLPADLSGQLEQPGDVDAFRFAAAKGEKIRCRVSAARLGLATDAVIAIRDPEGKAVAEQDDVGEVRDPELTFDVPADGMYQLEIRDLHDRGGQRFAYRLEMFQVRPDVRLTLEKDSFTLAAGKSVEVPVKIERLDGFSESLEIRAELPAGITAEPVVSAAEGDSAKEVKLVLTAAGDASSGPFRVLGRAGELERTASFAVENLGSHEQAYVAVQEE